MLRLLRSSLTEGFGQPWGVQTVLYEAVTLFVV